MALQRQGSTPATRVSVAVFGVTLAVAGAHHGALEVWQGNRPTGTAFFMAVVPGQLGWQEGTEGALSLIPNFLLTGVAALVVAFAIARWSIGYVHQVRSALSLLLLFVLLTLVGGGVGHIAFFIPLCAYAARIDKPLAGWRRLLPRSTRGMLARLWTGVLTLAVVTFIIALEISIFGRVLGLGEEPRVLWICWAFLGVSWVLLHVAFACAAAADLVHRDGSLSPA